MTARTRRQQIEPFLVRGEPALTTETLHQLGDYVTAYASDLADPALVGQVLVMANHYIEWDENAGEEIVGDATGSFRVRPNGATRVGSAGPADHVTLGRVVAAGVLEEITWWPTEDVLRMGPEALAVEAAAVALS